MDASGKTKSPRRSNSNSASSAQQYGSLDSSNDVKGIESITKDRNGSETLLENIKSSCWICESTLRLPSPQFCWYAMHCHPHLQVPVCSVCSEAVLNVDPDSCWGCSESDDVLLICCKDCDKEYCSNCVAKANAGDEALVQDLVDGTEDWKCLTCRPTKYLQAVRDSLMNVRATTTTGGGATSQPVQERTFETVVDELRLVEHEYNQSIATLDQEEEQLQVIQQELPDKEKALEELESWKQLLLDHGKRLLDKISNLHDELTIIHGVKDLPGLYQYLEIIAPPKKMKRDSQGQADAADSDDESDALEPDYVLAANRAIRKREMAERQRQQQEGSPITALPKDVYKRDDLYSDAEEIDSEDEEDAPGPEMEQWRHTSGFRTRAPISRQDVQEALRHENEVIVRLKKELPKKVIRPLDDRQANMEEERQAGSGDAALPVRMDACLVLATRSKQQKQSRSNKKPAAAHSLTEQEPLKDPKTKKRISLFVEADDPPHRNLDELPTEAALSESEHGDGKEISALATAPSMSQESSNSCNGGGDSQPVASSQGSSVATFRSPKKKRAVTQSGPLVLCRKGRSVVRTVTVAKKLAEVLKPHQREGVVHMWQTVFADMEHHANGNQAEVGGCILAHNMGLGKSLSAIALIHTVHTAESMYHSQSEVPLINTVLVVVPSNTIVNWQNEFDHWIGRIKPSVIVDSIIQHKSQLTQDYAIERWRKKGGIFLVTECKLQNLLKRGLQIQPDLLIIDEAHAMLKTATNKNYIALSTIKTPRKILLTGTPFQNNLFEYFRMVTFIRPNAFPGVSTESQFDTSFVKPIQEGEASDATADEFLAYVLKTREINILVAPFVHRRDASVLRETLPPLQQVVLHLRQSREQSRLYRGYERLRKQGDESDDAKNYNNFLRTYHDTRLLHNHPGCLLLANKDDTNQRSKTKQAPDSPKNEWWRQFVRPGEEEKLSLARAGYKIVLLLHILAGAVEQDDKVLIFSESLSTLNFVEHILALDDWNQHVPTLSARHKVGAFGGWKRDRDYLRIDGSTSSEDRGVLVERFNRHGSQNSVKAFLISTLAGGVGINLTGANRVVLMDSHFNPSIPTQALFRCYRYGQKKRVFVYRLLTEGSIEQKVYNRSVMKNGLALRVIDDKSFNRSFTKSELADLTKNLTWVQCDGCGKWRVLLEGSTEDLPDHWFCKNNCDTENNSCDHPERDQTWYERRIHGAVVAVEASASPHKCMAGEEVDNDMPLDEKLALVENDPLLQELLEIEERQSNVVSRFYFHDAMLASTKDTESELESARKAALSASRSIVEKAAAVADLEKNVFAVGQLETIAEAKTVSTPLAATEKLNGSDASTTVEATRTGNGHPKAGPVANGPRREQPVTPSSKGTAKDALREVDNKPNVSVPKSGEKKALRVDKRRPTLSGTEEAEKEEDQHPTGNASRPRKVGRSSTASQAPKRSLPEAVVHEPSTKQRLSEKGSKKAQSDSSTTDEDSDSLPSQKRALFGQSARGRSGLKRTLTTAIASKDPPKKSRVRSEPARYIPDDADIIDLVDSDSD